MRGEQFGEWLLEDELSATAHGQRFRAVGVADPSCVAIVHLLKELATQFAEFETAFTRELLTLTKMSHPHVVAYYGGGIQQQRPYLITEWVDHTDYQTLLRNGERPTWQQLMSHALQLVSALRHAHRRGILHGDLKPANVWRLADGSVKLDLCGMTKFHPIEMTLNSANPLTSVAFISPEQASGKPGTKRSDFYALGCLLYALSTGRPPFAASNMMELVHKHCFVLPERPAHFATDLPHEIDAFILRLMAKDPQNRPGSGTLMLEELERLWAMFEARGQLPKRDPLPVDGPPSPLASHLKRQEQPTPRIVETVPRPLFSRASVVVPLFIVVVGLMVLGFQLSGDDADTLFAKAEPLMQSSEPADWEKAWTEYLEPLARRYPEQHADQIKAFRLKIEPLLELRRVQAAARTTNYSGEAERFFNSGLRLFQAGDTAGARKIWERTIVAFGKSDADQRWVLACRQALERTPPPTGALQRPDTDRALQALLAQARKLRAEGQIAEADAMLDALEALYAAEPDFAQIRPLIEQARQP